MNMRRLLLVACLLGLAAYGLTGVVQVRPGERVVIRRWGRVVRTIAEPGLWVGLPWGFDRVDRVAVDRVQSVSVGWQDDGTGQAMPSGQLLTGDHNLVNVQVTVYYKVHPDQVVDYVAAGDRIEGLIVRTAEAVLAEWIASRSVDDVLLRGKHELGPALDRSAPWPAARIVSPGRPCRRCARVALIALPDEVKFAFDEVARAQTSNLTLRLPREQESRRPALSAAQADRYRQEKNTAAYVHQQKLLAEREAGRFLERLRQYQVGQAKNPAYLRQIWRRR